MDHELQRELQRELRSGERLLWSGTPRSGVRLQPADAFILPFSLMWGGFAVYWEYSVIQQGAPLLFVLWGVPFVLIGIYLIIGRFLFDAKRRASTIYGMTDQRVLVVSRFPTRRTESLALASLAQITCHEKRDRSGTLSLGPAAGMHSWSPCSGWPGMGRYLAARLESIENVRDVQDRLLRAQEELTRGQLNRASPERTRN